MQIDEHAMSCFRLLLSILRYALYVNASHGGIGFWPLLNDQIYHDLLQANPKGYQRQCALLLGQIYDLARGLIQSRAVVNHVFQVAHENVCCCPHQRLCGS